MSKRQKFILISFLVTLGLWLVVGGESNLEKVAKVFLVSFFSVALTYLALRRELDGVEYITLLLPPFLLTLGFSLIFVFFPNFNTFFTLLILAAFFAIFYLCLLSSNIFSAAASKNLLLLKPAQTTFLLVVLTIFFLISTHVYKLGINIILQNIIAFALMYCLSFLVFWTQTLNKTASFDIKKAKDWAKFAAVTSFFASWWLGFLRLEPFFRSLVHTAFFNACLGIYLTRQSRQLHPKVVAEYLLIPLLALVFSVIVS
jgi:hypothetical protein